MSRSTPNENDSNASTLDQNSSRQNNAGGTHNASNITNVVLPNRFWLPQFDQNNPEIWFDASEIIFKHNAVNEERARFSYLIQYLDVQKLKNV